MTCENIRGLVHAYLDSELDLARSLEIEDHLRGCESCAREVADVRMLRTGIANGAVYHRAPPALEERVRSLLASQPQWRGERDTKLPRLGWTLIGAAAAVAFVAILLKDVLPLPLAPVANTTHEVVADHVRSLMANHLTDVASSNQHTVKPWFDGRLDFAPAVTDFKNQGFSLIGGRLDYVENHPVAAIVYKRREHVINLFVWPMLHMEDSRPVAETRDGFSVVHWTQGAMAYWAVSSVNTSELEKFADLVREAGSSPLPARQ